MRLRFLLAIPLVCLGMIATSAPATAGHPSTSAPATAGLPSPSVSPAVPYYYPTRGDDCITGRVCVSDPCPRGYFCASVWDPTRLDRKRYRFYHCGTYTLSHFFGSNGVVNNQTGGAVARLYGRNWQLLASYPADNLLRGVDWHDVWYVKPC